MSFTQYGSLIIVSSIIAGCCTTNDPKEGGLFCSIYHSSDGTYDERVTELNVRKDEVGQEYKLAKDKLQLLEREKAQTQRHIDDLEQQIAKIFQDIERLSAQVTKILSADVKLQKEKKQLNHSLKEVKIKTVQLKQQISSQQVAKKQQATAVKEIKKQAIELEQEINDLWEIYHTLQ